ncbi:MAG: hypothetical protein KAT90_10050, partial [Gammaproteobacteria bacterium]|nr:hypothetical protein [Gammaproteobacteria bacterium]
MNNYTTLVDVLIKDECAGNPRHEQILLLGSTPEYLIKHVGFPELDLAIKGSVISKAYFDHGISTSLLKRMHDIVSAPKCVFRPADT